MALTESCRITTRCARCKIGARFGPLSALARLERVRLSLVEATARRLLTLRMYCLLGVSGVLKDTCAFRLLVSLFRFYLLSSLARSPIPRPSRSRLLTVTSSCLILTVCSFPSFHLFFSGVISYILKYTVISSIHLTRFSCFLMSSYGLPPLPLPPPIPEDISSWACHYRFVCEEFFLLAVQLD